MKRLDHYWYSSNPVALVLLPLSWLFCVIVFLRRLLYRRGVLKSYSVSVPVIVVGNITVGGTGKTPLVAGIVNHLKKSGYRPAVVSRGYGGTSAQWPQAVEEHSNPAAVGDEPVLLANQCGCPIMVGPDRVRSATQLIDNNRCDVLVCDDGLQHYRLQRDIEIAVVDGERRFGNGFCLPAGPLRETKNRLKSVSFVVCNGISQNSEINMQLKITKLVNLATGEIYNSLTAFPIKKVHAIAGIGNPQRFFKELKHAGMEAIEHAYPDHYAYAENDIEFNDNNPVLMTEKDAVKCRPFADSRHWYVAVEAELDGKFFEQLSHQLRKSNG